MQQIRLRDGLLNEVVAAELYLWKEVFGEDSERVMKIVIWGVGTWGKRIYHHLRPGEVVAFIDSDPDKIGSDYEGISIINLEQYIKEYSHYFILVSPIRHEDILQQLEDKGIYSFFKAVDCPVEIHGAGEYPDTDIYLNSLNKGGKYGIFGTNFYSVYCYDRMRVKADDQIFLIPEPDCDRRKIELMQKAFGDIKFMSVDECLGNIDQIFVATDVQKEIQALKRELGAKVGIEDVFDLSQKITGYANPEIAQFRNVHEGKRCFIVATGPSLTMTDLDKLYHNGEISIGMNRIYLAFEQTQWRPEYYMVADLRCIRESGEILKEIPVPYKFIGDSYADFWTGNTTKGIYRFHENVRFGSELPPFSEELIYGVYSRATVTYGCIQLAVYLGFKEIYLLGVDFDFSSDYKDGCNHFISTYYNKNSHTSAFFEKESLGAYEVAKEYADTHGIKIYNATRGGKLEVFERVDFDTLFN